MWFEMEFSSHIGVKVHLSFPFENVTRSLLIQTIHYSITKNNNVLSVKK